MARSFFDFFPTPRFLEMPATGLALTDVGVKLIEFKRDHENLLLKQFGEERFPEGAISQGKIIDVRAVVSVLEAFRKKHNIEYVRTNLPEERAYLFRTKIINSAERDLKASVEFSIEENVPLSVAEAVFDYTILSKTENEHGDEVLELAVTVIPQVVVTEYLEMLNLAGLQPLHFETESQSITKAVVPRSELKPILVINLSKDKAGLYIVKDREVAFSSLVPVSFPTQDKTYVSEIQYLAVNEEGKNEKAVSQFLGLEAIFVEIRKIFLYWQTQADRDGKPHVPIDSIIVCGEESSRKGIVEFLSEKTKLPTQIANVWVNAFSFHDYVPDIPLDQSLGFASAIGLALIRKEAP